MIVLPVKQGSPEWQAARLGIPTASRFSDIMTPKTRKPSASATRYMHELLAERILGVPVNEVTSAFMERGSLLEQHAVSAYELEHDCDTQAVGFVLEDGRRYGCSPDRFVGESGMLQVKCPSAAVHIAALLDNMDPDYFTQVQGELWVCGRAWSDLIFYNPALPKVERRIERDAEFIHDLEECVVSFCGRLQEAERLLRSRYDFGRVAA